MHLASIHVYPIKACGGVEVPEWEVDGFGLRHDRRWMVVTPRGQCLTQRDHPRFALVRPEFDGARLVLAAPGMADHRLDPTPLRGEPMSVQVWDDVCTGWLVDPEADAWLSRYLDSQVRLAWMPPVTVRPVDPHYSPEMRRTSFTDGFPFLLVGQASLEELNARLAVPLPMNRFRPNLVVTGAEAFAEDQWRRLRIGGLEFDLVKPCARCMVTTTDQATGERGQEPLRTLATYRRVEGEVMFGQNLIHRGQGRLRMADPVEVLQAQQ
jgi:uncharacterized protein YcbX